MNQINVSKFRVDDRIVSIPKNELATVISGPERTQHGDMYYVRLDSTPDVLKKVYDDYWLLTESPLVFVKGEEVIYVNPETQSETRGVIDGPAFDTGGMNSDVIKKGSMPVPEPLYFISIDVPVDYVTKTSNRKVVNSNHLKKIVKISLLRVSSSTTSSPSIASAKIAPVSTITVGDKVIQFKELQLENTPFAKHPTRKARKYIHKKKFAPHTKFATNDGREGVVLRKAQYDEFGLNLAPTIDHYVVKMTKGDADIVKDPEESLMIGSNMKHTDSVISKNSVIDFDEFGSVDQFDELTKRTKLIPHDIEDYPERTFI